MAITTLFCILLIVLDHHEWGISKFEDLLSIRYFY